MASVSKAKVLITGAGGFIGSHLSELCLQETAHVRAFVRYNSRNDWGMLEDLDPRQLERIQVISGDVRDPDAVREAIRNCDVVFHLAALIGIPYSYVNPRDVVSTNVLGSLNILQACREFKVGRLVLTSTSEVYGTAAYVPMDESHPLNPQSPYAASKLAADKLAESFFRTFGLPLTILRPFNTYGPGQTLPGIIPATIQRLLKGEQPTIAGDGEQMRDFVYVDDTVRGIEWVGENGEPGKDYDITTGNPYTIKEVVELICKEMGYYGGILYLNERAGDTWCITGESDVPLRNFRTLREGIMDTVQWWKERNSSG